MEENLFTLENLTLREIKALRIGLNHISITGVDAFFIGVLQIKLNNQITQIEEDLNIPISTPTPVEDN